ncbi:variable large family protein [Borrelia coriaceae]|uniref:variable large family protein n=1 Tax=Borrelia coriaceae TaxID=144 RepID=UPI0004891187|nr:variable large family protein [Borrelia coriaceae]
MEINIKNIKVRSICAILFISLFLSCNNGVIEELEKRKSFADSLVKIGHNFQEIFGSFGNAFGDALGFSAVKSGDTGSAISEHFEKIKKGLGDTKGKLNVLAKEILVTPHADTKGVEAVIQGASEVITKLIDSVGKLTGVTKQAGKIGDTNTSGVPKAADKIGVEAIISGVQEIIDAAKGVGVNVGTGTSGEPVANSDGAKAPAALVGKTNNKAGANAGPALADEVAKADPWAMLDKIKDAKTGIVLVDSNNYDAGALATAVAGGGVTNVGAKSNADLAAAVALKAMTQTGTFSVDNTNETPAVKGAAVSAVNKVLGILDEIIRQTINIELGKIKEAVKKIQYSETTGEATEGKN